jgi:P4 family phage/plasmid primase-like protien
MNKDFYHWPDKLAEMYLEINHVWEPSPDSPPEQYRDGKLAQWSLKWWRGGFYEWHNGWYISLDDENMKAAITRFLQDLNRMPYNPPDPPIRVTEGLVRNILRNLSGFDGVYVSDRRELNTWLPTTDDVGRKTDDGTITISFLNGLLIFNRVQRTADGVQKEAKSENLNAERCTLFAAHTPQYFSTARLPYNYDKDARCPRWEAFLDDVMQGDSQRIELLQEWAGYLLTDSLRFHKFLLLAGEGGNGKTVFTTLIEKMVGLENVSHIPLSLFGDKFSLASTLGKMLNSTSESSHGINELCETMLKSYTSGDRMTFERKYREPLNAHPTAKIMISTNQLPNFADKSNGVWRRLLFVPFDKCIPADEQDPHLIDKLSAELPGIFNWAYRGLLKLLADGQFIEPRRCKMALAEYRRDTNPARVFLEENYTEGFEFEGVPCGEVYQAYVAWCSQNGYRPLNASNFGKEVKRAFVNVRKEHSRVGSARLMTYAGLAVKEGSEVAMGLQSGNSGNRDF